MKKWSPSYVGKKNITGWQPEVVKEKPDAAVSGNKVKGADFITFLRELQVGAGDKIFRASKEGIWLGSEQFATAPFRVSMAGIVLATGYTQLFIQASIPTSLHINDVWWKTDDGNKPYYAASVGADQIAAGEWIAFPDGTIATAQAAAEAAQSDADTANAAIADIASDSILSQVEKPSIVQNNAVILAEQAGIDAQATAYGITTEKTAYDNAVTALTAYLATLTTPVLWSNLTGDTTIVGATFRSKFSDVYTTKQALLDAIAAAAGTLATWAGVSGAGKPADNADVTADNTAAAIAGQGALATVNTADFSTQVSGAEKPANNATKNRNFIQPSTNSPSSPITGDTWSQPDTKFIKKYTEDFDSYSETNQSSQVSLGAAYYLAAGQSLIGVVGALAQVKFYLKKTGTPTGNATAVLYAHTGTYGSTGTPTGAALATSDVFDVSTLTTSYALTTFTFSTPYTMTIATNYFIVLNFSGGSLGNNVQLGIDNSSPTHGGNLAQYDASWAAVAGSDVCFYGYINGWVTIANNYQSADIDALQTQNAPADAGATDGATAGTNLKDSGSVVLNDTEVKNIVSINYGETIAGATLPVPVYVLNSDGEVYKCDANAQGKLKFFGFALSTKNDGESGKVQVIGIVPGFSGLTVGAKYYVSDTVGTISTTPGTLNILVGKAVSATQIKMLEEPNGAIVAGDNLLISADTQRDTSSTSYVKLKEIECSEAGTYRIKWGFSRGGGAFTVYTKVYKNGVAHGSEQTGAGTSPSFNTITEDLAFAEGDLIQLYGKVDSGAQCIVNNFRIYAGGKNSLLTITD